MPKIATAYSKINPSDALYIKLGRGGKWEEECLEKGILRFGYKETPFEAAVNGDWVGVKEFWLGFRGDAGTATRDVIQIRHFFEADDNTLWITFYGGKLYWCFAKPGVIQHEDGQGSYRQTLDGWHDCDIKGEKLLRDRLSGNLLKVEAFRGTICSVSAFDYLKRKINGELLQAVAEAINAESLMVQKIIPLMRLLTWQDFELLVDLVFASSGWRRIGQLGKTQKTVDIELMLPSTRERALVQIKSETRQSEFLEYCEQFQKSGVFDRMFYIWHTAGKSDITQSDDDRIVCIGPEWLARMVFDAGLTSWLRDKVS